MLVNASAHSSVPPRTRGIGTTDDRRRRRTTATAVCPSSVVRVCPLSAPHRHQPGCCQQAEHRVYRQQITHGLGPLRALVQEIQPAPYDRDQVGPPAPAAQNLPHAVQQADTCGDPQADAHAPEDQVGQGEDDGRPVGPLVPEWRVDRAVDETLGQLELLNPAVRRREQQPGAAPANAPPARTPGRACRWRSQPGIVAGSVCIRRRWRRRRHKAGRRETRRTSRCRPAPARPRRKPAAPRRAAGCAPAPRRRSARSAPPAAKR